MQITFISYNSTNKSNSIIAKRKTNTVFTGNNEKYIPNTKKNTSIHTIFMDYIRKAKNLDNLPRFSKEEADFIEKEIENNPAFVADLVDFKKPIYSIYGEYCYTEKLSGDTIKKILELNKKHNIKSKIYELMRIAEKFNVRDKNFVNYAELLTDKKATLIDVIRKMKKRI